VFGIAPNVDTTRNHRQQPVPDALVFARVRDPALPGASACLAQPFQPPVRLIHGSCQRDGCPVIVNINKRFIPACCLVAPLVAFSACSSPRSAAHPLDSGAGPAQAAPSGEAPSPPSRTCPEPANVAALTDVRKQSQAAVVGTTGAKQTVADGGTQVRLRPLSVDRVLEGDKSLTGTTVYIVTFYPAADDLGTGNSYVAFLTATPEPSRYYLTSGDLGLLNVVSNSVTHSCVDFSTGKLVPAVGGSQGESLDTFAQQLKQNPVVPDSAASH
jgi:hypothetical protein